MSVARTAGQRRPSHAPVLGLLFVVVALTYANSLPNQFTFDDEVVVADNTLIRQAHHLPTLLTSDYWAGARDLTSNPRIKMGLYRPLVLLSYAANFALGGLNPLGYHLVNVLLHFVVSGLLYLLAAELGLSIGAATVAAVFFAVHPIHTEAVSGIVGRAELMMAASVLASLWWGIRGRLGLSLIAFASGLFSKEQAVMLLALVVLYDVCVQRTFVRWLAWGPTLKELGARYGLYALVLVVYVLIRGWALGSLNSPPASFLDNPLAHLDWSTRLLNVIKVAGRYLSLCLWPAILSADYSYNAIPLSNSPLDTGVWLALVAWGSLLGLALWAGLRNGLVGFAVGFLVLTFFPASNLIVVIGTIMGERLFYLPSAGLCLLCGIGYDYVARKNKPMGPAWLIVLAILCLGLSVRTVVRNRDWFDTQHLAESALKVVPNDAKMHSVMGRLAKDKGHWDEAIEHFATALRIYPDYTQIDVRLNSNLGISLFEKGFVAEGTEALERAVRLDPGWSVLHYNLGYAYARQGRYREAQASYRRALSLNDEDPKAHTGLGYLYLQERRYQEALNSAEAALLRDQRYIEAHYVRARALQALGRLDEAAEELREILILDPNKEGIRQELDKLQASTSK